MLDYLEEWDKLNRTPVFDIASHQALMIWQQDVLDRIFSRLVRQ